MYIRPIASEIIQQSAKKAGEFFPYRAPLETFENKGKIVIRNLYSDIPAVSILEVPKAELEKITRIFW